MFNANMKISEELAIVAISAPQTTANTEKFSSVIDMSKYLQVLAVAQLGDMAAETIDFKMYSCDSDGSNAAAVSGYAATQLAAHASNNDSKQLAINARHEALLASAKQYCKFGLVTGAGTGGPAAILVLGQIRQGNVADQDLASVLQIV